jgi:Tfp pilus assembly protein PilF
MKETWKDYIAPGVLACGLLMLFIGVAVFGSPVHERQINRSYMTVDDSLAMMFSSDERVDVVILQPDVEETPPAKNTDRLGKPASTNCIDMCAWNNKLKPNLRPMQSCSPEEIPQLIERFTELKESDGAVYFYALAYVADHFSRISNVSREANYRFAIANYTKAIERDDTVSHYYHFRGQTHYFYGKNTHLSQPLDMAIADYKKAATIDPEWAMPLVMQGWAFVKKQDRREAYRLFNEALKLDPIHCCNDAKNEFQRLRTTISGPAWQDMAAEEKIQVAVVEEKTPVVEKAASATQASRVKAPETRDSYELDGWDDGIYDLVKGKRDSYDPAQVLKIIQEQTDLKESDGAFYYYAIGHLHDSLMRNSKTFRKSNYVRAVENYTKAIELDDSVALFHHFRGQVNYYYALNENAPEYYEKAVENYKAAAKRDPKWPMPLDMQGWTAFYQGKYDEAIQFLEQALEIDPECLDALNCIIQVYAKKTDKNPKDIDAIKKGLAGIERLHTLLKEGKKFGNLSYVPGYARQLLGKLKLAENISPKTHPKYYDVRGCLDFVNQHFTQTRSYQEALALLEEFDFESESILFFPGTSKPEQKRLQANRNYYFGACYYETGDYEKAFEAMTACYADLTPNTLVFSFLGGENNQYYYFKSAVKLGRFQECVDMVERLNLANSNMRASGILGEVIYSLFKTGKSEEAMKLIGSGTNMSELARILVNAQDREIYEKVRDCYLEECCRRATSSSEDSNFWLKKAEQLFEMDAPLDDKKIQYLKSLAETLVEREDYVQAIRFYERYLQCVPADEAALYSLLGVCKLNHAYNEQSFNVASQLIAVAPKNADYWTERACIVFKSPTRKKTSLAIYDLTRAIELLEANGASNDRLQAAFAKRAECHKRDNKIEIALEDCMKIVALAPPNAKIEEIRVEAFEQGQEFDILTFAIDCMIVYPSRKHSDAVAKYCTELIQRGGDECRLLEQRFNAYYRMGQLTKAIDDFLVLLQFAPSQDLTVSKEKILYYIGDCYGRLDNFDQGIEYLTLAIEENPNNGQAYGQRSHFYGRKAAQPFLTKEEREHYQELARQDEEKAKELLKDQQQ